MFHFLIYLPGKHHKCNHCRKRRLRKDKLNTQYSNPRSPTPCSYALSTLNTFFLIVHFYPSLYGIFINFIFFRDGSGGSTAFSFNNKRNAHCERRTLRVEVTRPVVPHHGCKTGSVNEKKREILTVHWKISFLTSILSAKSVY